MKNLLNIILVLLLIGAAVYITHRFFPKEKVITKTYQTTDTIWKDTVVYKQLPPPKPDTIIKTDTIIKYDNTENYFEKYVNLYQKFYRQNIYKDTLKNDSVAFISVYDVISENKIGSRKLTYKDRTPTVINKTIHKEIINQRKLFIGVEAGMNSLSPSVMYKDLNDVIYKAGYDVYGKNKGPRVGIYVSPSLIF